MDLLHKSIVRYKDEHNVTIREINRADEKVVIEIVQEKTLDGQYFSMEELKAIAISLFASIHDDFHIGAIPYVPLAHEIVDSSWLKAQLANHAMKLKTLARILGISKSVLLDHHSGTSSISNTERAMYYYYFQSLNK